MSTTMPEENGKPVYQVIKEWIYDQKIESGVKVSERSIAEAIGLSRVPVREAFQRLTLEGLLVNIPGKGLCVREYNEQDIYDLYVYREAIDGMASRYFAIRAESMEINYLKMVFEEMERTASQYNAKYWEEKDMEFHRIIARGSRNVRLSKSLENVLQECLYLSKIYFRKPDGTMEQRSPEHLQLVLSEHRKILAAIESGDPDEAERVSRSSVQEAMKRVLRNFVLYNRQRFGSQGAVSA
jgi:DNA-binding GntR family transcriptional regulator